jgi:hypothetical protein
MFTRTQWIVLGVLVAIAAAVVVPKLHDTALGKMLRGECKTRLECEPDINFH